MKSESDFAFKVECGFLPRNLFILLFARNKMPKAPKKTEAKIPTMPIKINKTTTNIIIDKNITMFLMGEFLRFVIITVRFDIISYILIWFHL